MFGVHFRKRFKEDLKILINLFYIFSYWYTVLKCTFCPVLHVSPPPCCMKYFRQPWEKLLKIIDPFSEEEKNDPLPLADHHNHQTTPPPPPPYPSPSPPLGWSGIELFFNFRKQALCCIFFYVKFQTIGEFGRVRAAKFSLSKNHRDLKNAFKKLQIPSFYFTEQSA